MSFSIKDDELTLLWMMYHNQLYSLAKGIRDKTDETILSRESFLRIFFSGVEALTFRLRQILLERVRQGLIKFSPEEVIILSEKKIKLDNKGKVSMDETIIPFIPLFRFTIKTYAIALNKERVLESHISKKGYENFQDARKIRNRIAHPTSFESLEISNEEFHFIDDAWSWFHSMIIELLKNDIVMEK